MILKEIKDFPNYKVSEYGEIYSYKSNKIRKLKPYLDSKGNYYMIRLFNSEGKRTHIGVHRLVALAFLNKPNKDNLEVNHKDSNMKNNYYKNLEWITHKENLYQSYKTMSPIRNFRECSLYKDDTLIKSFKSIKEACRYGKDNFNVSASMLEKYHKNKNISIKFN